MTFPEFKYLVTNITAIINQAFTIQCGEFATAITQDQEVDLPTKNFDTENHLETFDFQAVLDSGYHDMNDLDSQFHTAWDQADPDILIDLISQTPDHLPKLTEKLNAKSLTDWIRFSLDAADDSPLYKLHQVIMTLFEDEKETFEDVIREAIAYDKVDELEANKNAISAEQIEIDDLTTAATIESFNALEWLLAHATLSDNDIVELLENTIDDPSVSKRVVELLQLTSDQKDRIMQVTQDNETLASLLK